MAVRGLLGRCIVLNPSHGLRTAREEGETKRPCDLAVAFRSHVPVQQEPSWTEAVLKLGYCYCYRHGLRRTLL